MTNAIQTVHIASDVLSADVSTMGAELQNLSDPQGRPLQWDGDPTVWAGRAPILFPFIGASTGGGYRLDGRFHAMPRHGFARRSAFAIVARDETSVRMTLAANDETRASYPFEFVLEVAFALEAATLRVVATVTNNDRRPMPASLGFHPAFRWPLPYGEARAEHRLRFERDEPAAVRRLDGDGLLLAEPRSTPVVGDTLALRDALFDDDALIFDRLASRSVRYGAARGPHLDVGFDGFPTLGVWTKPGGAAFICIEPWQGTADPVGFDGDVFDKPGIVVVAPGQSRDFAMTIAFDAAAGG